MICKRNNHTFCLVMHVRVSALRLICDTGDIMETLFKNKKSVLQAYFILCVALKKQRKQKWQQHQAEAMAVMVMHKKRRHKGSQKLFAAFAIVVFLQKGSLE